MEDLSYQCIHQSCEYLTSLGEIRHRAHFGGYSLSVDDTVFAMVAEGELYLRACEQSAQYAITHDAPLLIFNKRGREVSLNYYFVDQALWNDRPMLLELSAYSLDAARREKVQRSARKRLRDLPNLTFQIETQLRDAGIMDIQTLRLLGAKASWLRLRKANRHLGVKILLALEGAIVGLHEAALPAQTRQELIEWFAIVMKKTANPH